MTTLIEAGGRQYGKRALVGTAPSLIEEWPAVRAFAPYRLSTVEKVGARYIEWLIRMVTEVIETRGGDITNIEWQTMSARELIETTGGP